MVGKVILKDKEHVIALRAYQKGIVMHVLHFLDEVRPMDEIEEITQVQKMKIDNKEELSLANLLVEKLSTEHFDLSKYSDSYSEELKHLIEAKSKGKTYSKSVEVEKKRLKIW